MPDAHPTYESDTPTSVAAYVLPAAALPYVPAPPAYVPPSATPLYVPPAQPAHVQPHQITGYNNQGGLGGNK